MTQHMMSGWLRAIAKVTCILLATATLGGCIVVPYPGYHHPRYWYRY